MNSVVDYSSGKAQIKRIETFCSLLNNKIPEKNKSFRSLLDEWDNTIKIEHPKIKGGALLIAGEAGTLFSSSDMGETWEALYGPYQGSYFGIQNTKNEHEVLVYGLRGNVFKSVDDGQSWQKIETTVNTSLSGSSLSANGMIALVGFSGTVLMSNDDGQSFVLHERSSLDAYNAVEIVAIWYQKR